MQSDIKYRDIDLGKIYIALLGEISTLVKFDLGKMVSHLGIPKLPNFPNFIKVLCRGCDIRTQLFISLDIDKSLTAKDNSPVAPIVGFLAEAA